MDRPAESFNTKLDLPFILNQSGPGRARRHSVTPSTTARLTRAEKKKKRECTVDGCSNYIVHKGLCCKHGGGKKCARDGCNSSAKHNDCCWKHGGSMLCKVDKCMRKAKARGLCWAHGGGTKCRRVDCAKVAVSSGLCWAHGGGKRCRVAGCIKPGYARTDNLCPQHFALQSARLDSRLATERMLEALEERVLYIEL